MHSPEFINVLLGFKIVSSIALFLSGLWLIYLGFQRAGNALDYVLDGWSQYWLSVGLWLLIALAGALGSSAIVTYWLSV